MRAGQCAPGIALPASIPDELDAIMANPVSFVLRKQNDAVTAGLLIGKTIGISCNLWLKRFNFRGYLDLVGKIIVGSRARRLFEVNSRLQDKGLPVPQPIAFFEPTLFRKSSFFISTFIEHSEPLSAVFLKGGFVDHTSCAPRLAQAIADWHASGAVHGDLKWSNILMQKTGDEIGFVFVDLDQATLSTIPDSRGIEDDLTRFYRYGIELGTHEWVDTHFFPAYLDALDDAVRRRIDLQKIRDAAGHDWQQRGRRRLR